MVTERIKTSLPPGPLRPNRQPDCRVDGQQTLGLLHCAMLLKHDGDLEKLRATMITMCVWEANCIKYTKPETFGNMYN